MSTSNQIVDHFFRRQSAKIVAILSKIYGLVHIETIEDCVQDTMITALEQWALQSIPDKPEAWLIDVARKKLINQLNRASTYQTKVLASISNDNPHLEEQPVLTDHFIKDTQLRMLLACCHPGIQQEGQIALALKTLCGFGVQEIANALFTSKDTVNKQLYRAKQMFRNGQVALVMPGKEQLEGRLNVVLKTIYLVFNEGYFSAIDQQIVSKDICFESIRMGQELESAFPDYTPIKAFLALALFQFARFDARYDEHGVLLLFEEQNRLLWNKPMIDQAMSYLNDSQGDTLSEYHIQAGILAEYVLAERCDRTCWENILKYYDLHLSIYNSDYMRLNYAIALFKAGNEDKAEAVLQALEKHSRLKKHWQLYFALSTFYFLKGDPQKGKDYADRCTKMNAPPVALTKLDAQWHR
ncbi:MAG: sigma-70 family RNA polymerase sigma factor [Bacteroidota bacterium]